MIKSYSEINLVRLAKERWFAFLAIFLIVLVGGLRFSDGSMLLAISRGATIADEVFLDPFTQYVWDSPLKVYLLWVLPSSILFIAAVFAFIGIFPSFMFFAKQEKVFFASAICLLLTPAFKVSMQNLGVGDGILITLVIAACLATSHYIILICFLLIGLWHPQQAFFIGVSWLVANYLYADKLHKTRLLAGLCGLIIAAAWFFYFKAQLGFGYAGRSYYITAKFDELLIPNLKWAALAFLPTVCWFVFIAPKSKQQWVLMLWLLLLSFVALLTADVTRVMTMISLPLVLMGALAIYEREPSFTKFRKSNKNAIFLVCALVIVIPPYSWSGLDYFLWGDLISDLCKWGVIHTCAEHHT
jgi:hypothetical protein